MKRNPFGRTTSCRQPGRTYRAWPVFLLAVWLMGCASGKELHGSGNPGPEPGILSWYQKYISPVDGDRCPMVPTCSAYARDAVHRHGWLAGWILTCERLIRCGRDETHLSPVVIHNHQLRTWDPVQANVWLGKEPSP